jgi:hypothetical protein
MSCLGIVRVHEDLVGAMLKERFAQDKLANFRGKFGKEGIRRDILIETEKIKEHNQNVKKISESSIQQLKKWSDYNDSQFNAKIQKFQMTEGDYIENDKAMARLTPRLTPFAKLSLLNDYKWPTKSEVLYVPQNCVGHLKATSKQGVCRLGTTGIGTCVGLAMWKKNQGIVAHFDSLSEKHAGSVVSSLMRKMESPQKIWLLQPIMTNIIVQLSLVCFYGDIDQLDMALEYQRSHYLSPSLIIADILDDYLDKYENIEKFEFCSSDAFYLNVNSGVLNNVSEAFEKALAGNKNVDEKFSGGVRFQYWQAVSRGGALLSKAQICTSCKKKLTANQFEKTCDKCKGKIAVDQFRKSKQLTHPRLAQQISSSHSAESKERKSSPVPKSPFSDRPPSQAPLDTSRARAESKGPIPSPDQIRKKIAHPRKKGPIPQKPTFRTFQRRSSFNPLGLSPGQRDRLKHKQLKVKDD